MEPKLSRNLVTRRPYGRRNQRDGPLGDYPIGAAQLLVHVASYVARSRR
jgi:hypothetical protein